MIMPFFLGALCDNRMIRPLIIDTLCTLSQCCLETEQHFVETFTALQELQNTVTVCCDDILISLSTLAITCTVELEATFTTLEDIKNTLTQCCASFESTLTEIISLLATLTDLSCQCQPVAINSAGTIAASGVYCLENDITGQITIASDNVVVDLNDHEITGGTNAIVINANIKNVIVRNGRIRSTTNEGVVIEAGCDNIGIQSINFRSTGGYAVSLLGTATNQINNCGIEGISTHACAGSINILQANNCNIIGNTIVGSTAIPININTGSQNKVQQCLIKNNNGLQSIVAANQDGLSIIETEITVCSGAISLTNCPNTYVRAIKIFGNTSGVVIQCLNSANSVFEHITASNILVSSGLLIQNSNNIAAQELVFNNVSGTAIVLNVVSSNGCVINGCEIANAAGTNPVVILNTSLNTVLNNISIISATGNNSGALIEISLSPQTVINQGVFADIINFVQIINVPFNPLSETVFLKLKDILIDRVQNTVAMNIINIDADNSTLENIIITNCQTGRGNVINMGPNQICKNIVINGITSGGNIFGFNMRPSGVINFDNTIIEDCIVSNLTADFIAAGFEIGNSNAIIRNCVANNVRDVAFSLGIGFDMNPSANEATISNCIANNCGTDGFLINAGSNNLGDCIAYRCPSNFTNLSAGNEKIYNNYAAKALGVNYTAVANVQLLAAAGPVVGVNIDGGF